MNKHTLKFNLIFILLFLSYPIVTKSQTPLRIDEHEQFITHGFSAMAFHNEYYEGRRGAVELVLHGTRVASNIDIRLEPVPIPDKYDVFIPEFKKRHVNRKKNEIKIDMDYPGLGFTYEIIMKGIDNQLRISANINGSIADSLYGKLAFMLELFPGSYKGKSYFMDDKPGIFPAQFNGPRKYIDNELKAVPMARGKKLSVAPEDDLNHFTIESKLGDLELVDGRASTNHKWFIIRSLVPKQKEKHVVEWIITPKMNEKWLPEPVVGISQIGYHAYQPKISTIEIHDKDKIDSIYLKKVSSHGEVNLVKKGIPAIWGKFYRKKYLQFDFSDINEEGMYFIEYRGKKTELFPVSSTIFENEFWRPSLETFIPVQMCHVAVKDRLRLWHGACHLEDARQVPANKPHFDHYQTLEKIETGYEAYEHIPHLNQGGWHDAGDVDIESSSNTSALHVLCQIYEEFHPDIDQMYVDYGKNFVQLHRPDGKPDVLQQIVHGASYILGNYRAFGFLSRGVISPEFQQYLQMGDAASQTDGFVHNPDLREYQVVNGQSGKDDDRFIFTNKSTFREYQAGVALSAASRCLKEFEPELSKECLSTALNIWKNIQNWQEPDSRDSRYQRYQKILRKQLAIELFLCTGEQKYKEAIIADTEIDKYVAGRFLWSVSRIIDEIDDKEFQKNYMKMLMNYKREIKETLSESPYGVPRIHNMFGTGFRFMNVANNYYYLCKKHPDIFEKDFIYNIAAYMHGNHPVSNHSLVNGVGAKSITSAYGINRADFSYIPGGICAGPLIVKPDLIEFRTEDPFFWVQKEYTIYSGTSYVFLMMALEEISGNN